MSKIKVSAIYLVFLLAITLTSPMLAQSQRERLVITDLDTSSFPEISLILQALDADGQSVTDLSNLVLTEDGNPVSQFTADPVDIGTDLIIVIDADTAIEQRDNAEGLTRREKIRDSIIRYANYYMNPQQLDRVTMIVPIGLDGRILDTPGLSFPNEVINAINFYDPGELSEPSLDRLMQMAMQQAADSQPEGRSQSILLYTDAGQLDEQLDLNGWAIQAQEAGVALHVAILGSRADPDEVESASTLVNPTGGAYAHVPNAEESDQLFELINGRADQNRVTYRSMINESGSHSITAELNGLEAEEPFEVQVLPPRVEIAVDNSRPIRRVTMEPDIPLEAIEPTHQPLAAQVTWPDGYPRRLESAALLVEGQEMPVENTILGDDGYLTFDWDIRFLGAGLYDIVVVVTDELNLVAESDPLPLEIIIEKPAIPETAAPTLTPQPAPTAEPENNTIEMTPNRLLIGGGAVAILVLISFLVILFIMRGRRSKTREVGSTHTNIGTKDSPSLKRDPDLTYIQPPDFAAESVSAYLEVLDNAPEHQPKIPIVGKNVAIGRDENRCQIVLQDQSVSRLHARIIESQGAYRIYDEGSSSGTYVNYGRLGLSPQTLQDQDSLHFGRVHLRFRLESSSMLGRLD